ncbi:hypothetical protein F5Y14DRAFT_465462 [Nemania sp. NC0429]|nr:hypothetical protein F5Y14DRAFT_465462 [Nemania sp. NC0429]
MAPQQKKTRGSKFKSRQDVTDSRRVLQTIKQVQDGSYKVTKSGRKGNCLIRRTLRPSGFKLLLEAELAHEKNRKLLDFFNGDEFHFDYTHRPFKDSKHFVIHLPSVFHASMTSCLRNILVQWLRNIADGLLCRNKETKSETMRVAGEITSSLTTRVRGDRSQYEQTQPDLAFTFKDSVVPGLVIDVTWSESDLDLKNRARHYMESEDGPVQTIIGFDMADIYNGSRHATFTVWKARRENHAWAWENVVPTMEFIDGNGEPIPDTFMGLSIYDFMGRKRAGKCQAFEMVVFGFSAEQLHLFYKVAFRKQLIADAGAKVAQIMRDATEGLETIDGLERTIWKQGTGDGDDNGDLETVIGKKELAAAKRVIPRLENKIGQMRGMMEAVETMRGRVNNGVVRMTDKAIGEMEELEKEKCEAEDAVAELEARLAKARAATTGVGKKAISSRK